jgi:CubicO group peptidase (beta-lactamase class C family)
MFIAATVVRLAIDGVLSLDAHPSTYVPALKAIDRRITLHHLLSHTAGLADLYNRPDLRLEMAGLALRSGRLFDYLTKLPLSFEPGKKWNYSSTGFLLLAYVIEGACGSPLSTVVGDMFLTQLRMFDTVPDRIASIRLRDRAELRGEYETRRTRAADVDGLERHSTVADSTVGVAILDVKS